MTILKSYFLLKRKKKKRVLIQYQFCKFGISIKLTKLFLIFLKNLISINLIIFKTTFCIFIYWFYKIYDQGCKRSNKVLILNKILVKINNKI